MARIKRHAGASTRRLSRRSREEKRRLSEGGGGTARVEENPEPDYENQNNKIDLNSFTDEEVDYAYKYVFFFDEVYGSLVLKENELLREIKRYRDMKESLDQKISTLKAATRSSGSDNIKRIRGAERRSDELHNAIDQLELAIIDTRLEQSASAAQYKWYASIVDEDVVEDGEGLMFGLLGHVFRQ